VDPYIGEIRMFGGNFAPLSWAFCNGQTLPISEFAALFNLIGTTYGGDGQTTFALPNLQGRLPVHQGNGFAMGQVGGSETVTLTTAQLPAHPHSFQANPGTGSQKSPANNVPAAIGTGSALISPRNGSDRRSPLCWYPLGLRCWWLTVPGRLRRR
jgi:microcystin-dependent protein